MDAQNSTERERIFHEVLAKPHEEWASFLTAACADAPSMRGEIESMLARLASQQQTTTNAAGPVINNTRPGDLAGQRLGPYRLTRLLGVGAMGEVYAANDPRLSRGVAIKVLPPEFRADPDRLRRFQAEAQAAAVLSHPNILAIHDIGTDGATTYLVYELLEGQTLRARLADGPLPRRAAIDFAVQITNGLAAAHEKGIVHRDLKPANIFITNDGWAKILDFGLAIFTNPPFSTNVRPAIATAETTAPGTVLGTCGYMSPEQLRGAHDVDQRTDIFSLGATLYEMLTGDRAFKGDTSIDVITQTLFSAPPPLPVDFLLNELVLTCIQKDKTFRYQSCSDVLFVLSHVN
jgi:serine/threonine protein kinase